MIILNLIKLLILQLIVRINIITYIFLINYEGLFMLCYEKIIVDR